jgi:glycosidase
MHELQNDPLFLNEGKEDHKLVIYQLLPRLFTNTNTTNKPWGTIEENGVGKFNDIRTKALLAIQELGATHIWYTGVLEHATMTDYRNYGITLDDADIVKGRAGSPYAVKDYFDVDPDLAIEVPLRMQEFEALVQRTQQVGLKVIIDFVPNHLARFYQSDQKPKGVKDFGVNDDPSKAFAPNNNFYYLPGKDLKLPKEQIQYEIDLQEPHHNGFYQEYPARATGNDVFHEQPSVQDWFETVKLNYGVDYQNGGQTYFDPIPDTWHKMLEVLQFWAAKDVDGFRCDMAEMVPAEFWHWVIPQVKADFPELLFIAEIYNPELYRHYLDFGRFDYLYDKVQLYDTLKKITRQEGSTDWLRGIWQHLRGINHRMLRFLENHDEQRIASPDFVDDPWHALPAMMVSATWHQGPVMLYFGQEVGEPASEASGFSSADGRTTIFDYWGVPAHQKWLNNGNYDGALLAENRQHLRSYYVELMQFCRKYEAIRSGHFYDLQPLLQKQAAYSTQLLSYLRFRGKECLIFICNFSSEQEYQFRLTIPIQILSALGYTEEIQLQGIFGTDNKFLYDHGLDVAIPKLGSFVLQVE